MDPIHPLVAAFASGAFGVMASSGFWTYILNTKKSNAALDTMIRGLAHDRIIHIGRGYIRRGYITIDEYDDYFQYLVQPYRDMGGNGSAEKVIKLVDQLPVLPSTAHKEHK